MGRLLPCLEACPSKCWAHKEVLGRGPSACIFSIAKRVGPWLWGQEIHSVWGEAEGVPQNGADCSLPGRLNHILLQRILTLLPLETVPSGPPFTNLSVGDLASRPGFGAFLFQDWGAQADWREPLSACLSNGQYLQKGTQLLR